MPELVSFDGTAIHWSALGEGPPVVFLHGFASDATGNWVAPGIAPRVADAGFTAVLPDARGHGRSAKPHEVDAYRPPAMARDVVALIDHLGVDAVAVVGYSMGSTTAITAASLDARISSLVLGGAGATLLDAGSDEAQRRRQLGAAVLEVDDASSITHPAGIGLRSFVDANGGDRLALAAVMRAEEGLAPGALRVGTRTLVLTGDEDGGAGAPEGLAEALANASVVRLRGDHLGAVRDPTFADAVIEHLRG